MLIIGLIGGIASGKSAVTAELAQLGAVVLNADEAAHRVINYPEVKQLLSERWGQEILLPNGEVNRKAVAGRVFSPDQTGTEEREFLENLLHSRIRAEFETELENCKNADVPAAVIDAPLLLEAGWDEVCDVLLFVDSPREDRQQRAELLRNWSPTDFAAREAAQMPIEEKRRRATHVIANDGTFTQLREHVQGVWRLMKNKKSS
ncbi:MAG: dephospho-CoA kinase [Bythopirellula sp.]|nr:dephospho-CoA kinase [Bythopirellula sp.]